MTDRRPPSLPPPLPASQPEQQRYEPQRQQPSRPEPPRNNTHPPSQHVQDHASAGHAQGHNLQGQNAQRHGAPRPPAAPGARPASNPLRANRPGPGDTPKRRPEEWGKRPKDADDGRGVLAYVGIGLLALVLIVGGGAGYLALNPPVELIRNQLVAQVKASTGRELKISGPTKFRFYPSLGVKMANVQLSAPASMGGPPLLTAVGLDVSLKLLPLLQRNVDVERLVLQQPVIEFRTDKAGRRTWDLTKNLADVDQIRPRRVALAQAAPAAATPNRATDAEPPALPSSNGDPLQFLSNISLEDVRVINGVFVWHDERSGVRETASAVNLNVAMRSIASPMESRGDLVFKGERFEVTSSLASLRMILDAKPAKLAFNATNRLMNFGYDGSVGTASGIEGAGSVTFKSPNLRALAKLAGAELPTGAGFGPASLSGKLKADGRSAMLQDAALGLDGATATGSLGVEIGAARPVVRGNLKLSALDLNKYLGGTAKDPPPAASPAPSPSAPPRPSTATKSAGAPALQPGSIDDLLSQPGPQVKGFSKRAGWSEDPIVIAALGTLDADVKLQVQKLAYQALKIGQSQLAISLKNKVLTTTFDDVQLYQGRVRGVVTLDGSGAVPTLGANISADGIATQPLLKDAADMDWLAGTGRLAIAVAGQGTNQKDIMESLNGKAELIFNNGAIVGWNVAQIIRGLKQGQITGLERVATSKTDFSELSSTWAITSGVAQNQDLKMTTPLLRVTGGGSVAIGARQVDYVVKPKVVASLDGQGGAQGLTGLEVPLRVRGPWEKPEIQPELGGILKDPGKAIGAIKEIGKQFKGKKPNEIVDQVLGGNTDAAKKANELLNQFTKPKKQAQPSGAQ